MNAVRMLLASLLFSCILLYAPAAFPADDPISIRVTPTFGFAPLSIRIHTRVPKHEGNRLICVEVEGPMYRRSCQEHVGSAASTVTIIDFKTPFPYGKYVAFAELLRITPEGRVTTFAATRAPFESLEGLP